MTTLPDLIAKAKLIAAAATMKPWFFQPERKIKGQDFDAGVFYGTDGNDSDTYDLHESYHIPDYKLIVLQRAIFDELLEVARAAKDFDEAIFHKDLMESTRISCQYLEGRGTLVEALAKLEAKLRKNFK
jgi:hypothetical protein